MPVLFASAPEAGTLLLRCSAGGRAPICAGARARRWQ